MTTKTTIAAKEMKAEKRRLDNIGRAMAALGNAKRYAAKAGVEIDTHAAKMALIEASTAPDTIVEGLNLCNVCAPIYRAERSLP